MSLATITFWSDTRYGNEIPDILYSYLITITVNQAIGGSNKILRIIPISGNAPKPLKEGPFIIKTASINDALLKAFNILTEINELDGLRSNKNILKSEEKKLQLVSH
jgi:hypothetical protein